MDKLLVLNMIVKDEAHVIERCLSSVIKHIDAAVIHDTGSTDNTIQLMKDLFAKANKPLEVIEGTWEDDFGKARNVALDKTKELYPDCYLVFIDADEELHVPDKYNIKKIIEINGYADCYPLNTHYGTSIYTRKTY